MKARTFALFSVILFTLPVVLAFPYIKTGSSNIFNYTVNCHQITGATSDLCSVTSGEGGSSNQTNVSYRTVDNYTGIFQPSDFNVTNSSYISIDNATANKNWTSVLDRYMTYWTNQTLPALTQWNATLNLSLLNQTEIAWQLWGKWFNNNSDTIDLKHYSDRWNQTSVNLTTTTCSGTDKVSGIDNSTGIITCTTDQSGSGTGTSFTYYNSTRKNVSGLNLYLEILTIPLNIGKSAHIECNFIQNAPNVTTGIQYQVMITGSSHQYQVIDYFSSATAKALCSTTGSRMTCNATGSSGLVYSPMYYKTNTNQTSDGTFNISIKSELGGGTMANVTAGSWCRSVETTPPILSK